jgi:hypothetical protein
MGEIAKLSCRASLNELEPQLLPKQVSLLVLFNDTQEDTPGSLLTRPMLERLIYSSPQSLIALCRVKQ